MLDGCFLQIGVAWLQIGLSSCKAGGLLLSAISVGLIHENQPTVCKGTAFSWNKYQKQEENIIFQSFCDLGRQGRVSYGRQIDRNDSSPALWLCTADFAAVGNEEKNCVYKRLLRRYNRRSSSTPSACRNHHQRCNHNSNQPRIDVLYRKKAERNATKKPIEMPQKSRTARRSMKKKLCLAL